MLIVSLLPRVTIKSCAACLGMVAAFQGQAAFAEVRPVTMASKTAVVGTTEEKVVGLPGGGSDEFRARMAFWSVPAQPPAQKVEPVEAHAATKLVVSSPFGWRNDPIKGIRRRHSGIDLPGRTGTAIYATGDGIVTFAGWMSGYGNVVQIDHDSGIRTRFGHLSRMLVARGDTLRLGALIGRMGSTGRSTGTHLHYEVRAAGMPVNPLAYMGRAAPSYSATVWTLESPVNARWTGWHHERGANSLPESKIR